MAMRTVLLDLTGSFSGTEDMEAVMDEIGAEFEEQGLIVEDYDLSEDGTFMFCGEEVSEDVARLIVSFVNEQAKKRGLQLELFNTSVELGIAPPF